MGVLDLDPVRAIVFRSGQCGVCWFESYRLWQVARRL